MNNEENSTSKLKATVEEKDLIKTEEACQDREKHLMDLMSNKDKVMEKGIATANGLLGSQEKAFSGSIGEDDDWYEKSSCKYFCTIAIDGNLDFTLGVDGKQYPTVQQLWSVDPRIKGIIVTFFKYLRLTRSGQPTYRPKKIRRAENDNKILIFSLEIFEFFLHDYNESYYRYARKILPVVTKGQIRLCMFLLLFLAHKKRWVGTAAALFKEWIMYLDRSSYGEYNHQFELVSKFSRKLRESKDFLRAIGIGHERVNIIHKLWLIDSEVSNGADSRAIGK